MPGTTPTYALPYQVGTDSPDGASLGEDLALAVEAELERIDTDPVVRVYTSGTTAWNKPADLKYIIVEVVGGGGGGGGIDGAGAGNGEGGYGGGGGYTRKLFLASALSSSESAVVGAGGAGGAAGLNDGATGGTSTFKSLSATGGFGGVAMLVAATGSAPGGDGGVGSGGDINLSGQPGAKGRVVSSLSHLIGCGGMSGYGMGAGGKALNVASTGNAGKVYGGGGGGAYGTTVDQAGGAGAAGVVIVTEYYA